MKTKLIISSLGLGILFLTAVMMGGCGQSSTSTTTSPTQESLAIIQDVKMTGYNGISVASTESLTLSNPPSSLEFTIYSNYQDKITGAQVSINYASFVSVELQENNKKYFVANPSFSEGQNPISVKVTYSTGQTAYDYLKVIIASI